MAGITLAQAETQLAAYLEAETAVLSNGQAASLRARQLQRAGLEAIQKGITFWDQKVKELGGDSDDQIRQKRVVFFP